MGMGILVYDTQGKNKWLDRGYWGNWLSLKKKKRSLLDTELTKIYFRWIKYLKGKSETSSILEDNVRDYDVGTDTFPPSGKVQKCKCERKILVNVTTATWTLHLRHRIKRWDRLDR